MADLRTVDEARAALREAAYDGAVCPCCEQTVKVYRRQINSGMARSLLLMVVAGRDPGVAAEGGWLHVPTVVGARSREEGKLAYWGLVEESLGRREDGGRAGWWRVTDLGVRFAMDRVRLPKYALVYDGRVLGFEGPDFGIHDAIRHRFAYDELMGWL